MFVPFGVNDFIDRRAAYGACVGVVDKPRQPASSLDALTYIEIAAKARRRGCDVPVLDASDRRATPPPGAGARSLMVPHLDRSPVTFMS